MCLVIPHQISKIHRTKATTKDNYILDSSLVSVKIGDWVLEQNGFVITKISSKQARDIINLTSQK